ncbi:unnamed protein product [Calypogeia fissa]
MATLKYSVILKACPAMRQTGLMALYDRPFSLTAGFSFVVGYKDFDDPSLLNTEPFYVLQTRHGVQMPWNLLQSSFNPILLNACLHTLTGWLQLYKGLRKGDLKQGNPEEKINEYMMV